MKKQLFALSLGLFGVAWCAGGGPLGTYVAFFAVFISLWGWLFDEN